MERRSGSEAIEVVISAGPSIPQLATASDAGGRLAAETLPWLGVLAGVLVVLWLAALWIKRRVAGGTESNSGGFDPEALEQLRRDGSLTDEQYRAISRSMARRAAGLEDDATRLGVQASDGRDD
ncbi:MAG: hypothetical protein ACO3P9_10225 [Phycisphaerales bacterium]